MDQKWIDKIIDKESTSWKSTWHLTANLLLCIYSVKVYTKLINSYVGAVIPRTIVIHRDGISTGYVPEDEAEKFSLKLAELVEKDDKIISVWSNNLKEQGDKIRSLLFQFEKLIVTDSLDGNKFSEFIDCFNKYNTATFVVKRALDSVPEAQHYKFVEKLKEARMYTENVYAELDTFFNNFASYISKKEGISANLFLSLTDIQISEYFNNGKLPSSETLTQQRKSSALIVSKGEYEVILGEDNVNAIEKILVKISTADQIYGKSAFPGKIVGKAKVALNPTKTHVAPGEILIIQMTRPEYLNLVSPAAAIVTDAGGILCHATIIARELKKPCIVGTKNATKILKDGDLVEVDADKGTVRIIK